ncbi:membrane protein [Streptomyces fumigatiscleroticus]|nr:membrane protein [Streptomyces fumigatiscleroticus]
MRLTDISLNWLLPGAVLLLGMLAAVAVLARGKRSSGKDTSADDSWERSEERRRRKEAVYGTASYILLFCCAAVAAALSFHGLVGFGQQNLGLTGGWEYLVPFGLDGAAMFCSVLAVREASHGDAALGSRILVWTFAGAAAWFNWVHAPRGLGHAGAPHFFAGMSLSAAVLFDRALKQTRRAALREQGLVPRPLPQIRVVRWLRAPRETYKAWSLMLLEGVRTLDEAVEEVREDQRQKEETRLRRREQQRVERAQLKAISRGHRGFIGRGGGRQAELPAAERGSDLVSAEPAISAPELPVRARPSLQPVRSGSDSVTVDLTAEDDTMALPRLDSLERKLKDLEQQFG